MTHTENVGAESPISSDVRIRFWHLRVRGRQEHQQGRRGHAAGIGDIAESRSDNDASRFLLLGLHHMAGVTCFPGESVAGRNIAILRVPLMPVRARMTAGASRHGSGIIFLLGGCGMQVRRRGREKWALRDGQ